MTAVITRIALRYLSGILIAKGFLDAATAAQVSSDPDVIAIVQASVGTLVGAATELWYWAARKFGWQK